MYVPFEHGEIEQLENYLRSRDLILTRGLRAANPYSLTDCARAVQERDFKLNALLDRNLAEGLGGGGLAGHGPADSTVPPDPARTRTRLGVAWRCPSIAPSSATRYHDS